VVQSYRFIIEQPHDSINIVPQVVQHVTNMLRAILGEEEFILGAASSEAMYRVMRIVYIFQSATRTSLR
jgi:hypothetical protein